MTSRAKKDSALALAERVIASASRDDHAEAGRATLAQREIAAAFPHAAPLKSVAKYHTITRCGTALLRRLVDEGLLSSTVAATLTRLSPAAQDEVLRLGLPAARAVARELFRTLRDERARLLAQSGEP